MGTMQRQRRARCSFSREFEAEVVRLVRFSGKSIPEVARDLDLTETAVRAWVRQGDIDADGRPGLSSAEREELARLSKENRVLREERDILRGARHPQASDGFLRQGDPGERVCVHRGGAGAAAQRREGGRC